MDSQSQKRAAGQLESVRNPAAGMDAQQDALARLVSASGLLTGHSQTDTFADAVRVLTQLMNAHDGDELFRQLATQLGRLCGTSYCVVVMFDAAHSLIGSTLAFVRQGKLLDNVSYDVRGTPCEKVYAGEFCYYESQIQRLFPTDEMLVQLGLDAYMGIPLVANDGRVLGLLALLHESRISNASLAESLLRIVAARAASELERQDIEQMLESEQIRFSSVFEHARDAIFLHDATGTILDANRQACLNLGYERQELIGLFPMAFDPDATPERLASFVDRLRLGEAVTFETRHRRKDGEIFPVEIRLRSYRREGARFGVTIAIDLRERKAAAAELRAAQQRLELVLDASQIGFLEWDADTGKIVFSEQWRRQLGYTEVDAPATAEFWKSRVHPDDFSVVSRTLLALKTTGLESTQAELRIRRVDGGWRWIQLRAKAFRDGAGTLQRVVALHLDNTARKRAEIALQHQKSILERIAKGEPLRQVLESIVEYVESQVADSRCSIMLLRGERLWFMAGSRIPNEYSQEIDGIQIGPNVGSCGSAAFRGKSVVVSDLATDPLWDGYREFPLRFGLRSCWSVPIFAGKLTGAPDSFENVLGTFANYGDAPGRPTAEDFEVVGNAAYLAGIAIERAKSEETLRDSESRLAAVIANSPGVAIQFYDTKQRVVLWNHASEVMFGIRELDSIGKSLEELTNAPEDPVRFREACNEIARTGLPIGPREFEFRRADGGKGIALSTQFAIPGPRGEGWYACMDVDITERKNSEEAVRQSKEMLQLILDNIPQGVLWKDRHSRYLGVNAVVAKAMNVQKQSPIGLTDLEIAILSKEQAGFFMSKDEEVMSRNEAQFQIVEPMNVADGTTIWLNTNKIPLHDAEGNVTGILITWEDFTEKRKSQDLLHRNMALLRKTQSMAKMSGWSYDIATQKFSNAEESIRILPQRASEMGADDFTNLVHPDDRDKVSELWSKALAGQSVEMEHRMSVGDELRWIAIRAEPQRNEAGELVSILGVAQDITNRKRLEEQLIQSQKYEGLGVLAGGIAHEFNNILTSVLGNAELGLMNLPANSPATPILLEIGKAARRAASLTKQMLAYSGRDSMAAEPLQLEALIQDAAPVFLSLVANKAELQLKLSPASAVGDVIQLRQVAMQLACNAVESFEGKPGRIEVTTGTVYLSEADQVGTFALAPKSTGSFGFLEFADNGCGMDLDVASKIFDPFFSTKFAGRGLGLAAVLGIVKRHRGAVQVRTAPGQGTSIRVLIPQAPTIDSVHQVKAAPRVSTRPCVLLVEDEPTVNEFLSQLLSGAGYEVVSARNGFEGIDLANQMRSEIEIILLDVIMPRFDGWETYDRMRLILPATPIILMSGYDEQIDGLSRSQLVGAAGFLQKPFRPAQLFAAMKQALDASVAY